MDKAVILAAGRGTRMQRAHESTVLDPQQAEVANSGLKALMPVGGRPFIDYVLSGLADAGYGHACVVTGPAHDAIREHVRPFDGKRLAIEFAVQSEPLGTANAVAAASDFAAGAPFLLVNSDNYYPLAALAGLRELTGPGVAGFRPAGLCRGNIAPERLRNFAILSANVDGLLEKVVEKPDEAYFDRHRESILIGMNCWRFTPAIFEACRAIPRSARNEFELTDAVAYAIDKLGERFEMLTIDEPVLDLSTRADVADVAARLATVEVRL
jgi:glucose-1-phosphate thymidylyltransferase